ncbi:hypothetical protein ACQ9LF_08315 [Anaerohalosphaeraceae bacterium U12dextr]
MGWDSMVYRKPGSTGMIVLLAMLSITAAAGTIDRKALVTRHNVVLEKVDALSPLSVGNGRFVFNADITGLQTFPDAYSKGIPLTTMAEWGWHSFPNTEQYTLEQTFVDVPTGTRTVPYNIESKSPAAQWLRANPHQTSLARIGFVLKKADGSAAAVSDITNIHQELNLWTGVLTSSFVVEGKKVLVKTVCHPDIDNVAFKVQSDLIAEGRLGVEIAFAYPSATWGNDPADWGQPDKHKTTLEKKAGDSILIKHDLDTLIYSCYVMFDQGTEVTQRQPHHFTLTPNTQDSVWNCSVVFSQADKVKTPPPFGAVAKASESHWTRFWTSGGAIDLSGSSDPRWKELERRIVLSQYLTAIQSVQKYPPQETGLTCTSWFGKFHLEMHWWHTVHFALWDRIELFTPSLQYYRDILPRAREIARRQGYDGARWPKMVGPDGQDAPSGIGPLLIWQQPHPIYYAELCYRADPSLKTLQQYQDIVFETAAFMASYPTMNAQTQWFELGPPLITAREYNTSDYAQNKNPTFELAYWKWGLDKAMEWRNRLGGGSGQPQLWQNIAANLAPWPVHEGVYVEQEFPLASDGGHPCMLGAYGILPESPRLDRAIMEKTLEHVLSHWDWSDTWGWDYPMMAMTAARLGRGDLAIQSLLLDVQKNTYLPNGHNFQREGLPCYLPGNGGLLTAAAMMAAGWDNGPTKNAPGFPDDGTWVVRWENLKKMP